MILRVVQHMFVLQKSWSKYEAKSILTQRVKQDIKKFWCSCVNARFTASLASQMFTQCLRLRLLLLLRLLHKCESGLNQFWEAGNLMHKVILKPEGTAKYKILQWYPNGHSFFTAKYEIHNCIQTAIRFFFFYNKIQIFEICTQTTIHFSQRNREFCAHREIGNLAPIINLVLFLKNRKKYDFKISRFVFL